MSKEIATQIEGEALANVAIRPRKEVSKNARSQRNQERRCASAPKDVHGIVRGGIEPGANERDPAGPVSKHAVNHHFEGPRSHHREAGVQHHGHEGGQQSVSMRPQDGEEASPLLEGGFRLFGAVAAKRLPKQGAPRSRRSFALRTGE